jgi:hypothetical protein
VNWAKAGGFGDKYNVVPMKDFEKAEEYELEAVYSVMFGKVKYKSRLLFIGMCII